MQHDSLTRTDDRKTLTCGISGGKHFFFKMKKTVSREGKPDRRVLICEWCYEPKGKV